ncbi:hypothetical protein GAO09_29455 [Rhizobiales bacterium RZME27]|jgi:hypothetical protein|uniref:Uncharacterized protein n=1 Tax=Endobacterium cereale TaxID=2663029 RepID=A0A6A8AFW0_9HYPH|nr:hypothetical protein [Endobacterium cereale]MEB2845679.1 hypothetical protein [Endobacterium cereale]MQY50163.1 hypothetical protein [Endobacterium cereale]
MQLIEGQTFSRLKDKNADLDIKDTIFRNCSFDNCLLSEHRPKGVLDKFPFSIWKSDPRRFQVTNVLIENCKAIGCQFGPAILSDVTVSNSTANDLTIFWGTLFRRVRFVGRLSAFRINALVDAVPDAKIQAAYDRTRNAFYQETDWAIDISQARFTSFSCVGNPARLFRLDAETQGIVRRQNVPADWTSKFYETNAWGPWVAALLAGDDDDVVLATPLAKPKTTRDRFLADLHVLRDLGIVDPPPTS